MMPTATNYNTRWHLMDWHRPGDEGHYHTLCGKRLDNAGGIIHTGHRTKRSPGEHTSALGGPKGLPICNDCYDVLLEFVPLTFMVYK